MHENVDSNAYRIITWHFHEKFESLLFLFPVKEAWDVFLLCSLFLDFFMFLLLGVRGGVVSEPCLLFPVWVMGKYWKILANLECYEISTSYNTLL